MKLQQNLHLAYCTNIHRGQTWRETFENLERHTLAVRAAVSDGQPYAIGLRLSDEASRELSEPGVLRSFRSWLERENCYVFTINGFPYGRFHGTRVKEQVYAPDWTTRERLDYTCRLFDLLAELVPPGVEGSVSTVPVSFKEFIRDESQVQESRANLWRCIDYVQKVSQRSGRALHLGLEPEPLCYLETTPETVRYFEQLRADRPGDGRVDEFLGVNYDCCHLAVEFEEPAEALGRLVAAGIKLSKIHLSNALKVQPAGEVRTALKPFLDDVYFHQVVERTPGEPLRRYRDLDVALDQSTADGRSEWRIHFHIPLHSKPNALFGTTADHLAGVLDVIQRQPQLCTHFEMETYTWEVMPAGLKNREVVQQLISEYEWTLAQFGARGLGRA